MVNQPHVDRPTIRAHKRQFAWQILVPFLGMTALIITGVVEIINGGATQSRVWADISMIWLLAPMLFFALAGIALAGTIIYGMAKLLQIMPHAAGKTQELFARLSSGTRKVSDGAAKPFVWVRQARAVIKSIFRI
jgi:hypothetical protein